MCRKGKQRQRLKPGSTAQVPSRNPNRGLQIVVGELEVITGSSCSIDSNKVDCALRQIFSAQTVVPERESTSVARRAPTITPPCC
jgi:hypothetical protein